MVDVGNKIMRGWEQKRETLGIKNEMFGTKTWDVGPKKMRQWEQKHETLGTKT